MSVPAGVARTRNIGSGSAGPFAFNFVTYAAADLQLVRTSLLGVDTVLTLTTDYSVSLASDFTSAAVTLVVPLAGDGIDDGGSEILTITRDPAIEQLTQWPRNDPFPAATHERAADRAVMMIGRLNEKLGRAPLLKESSTFTGLTLPDPEANLFLGWNTAGTDLENKSVAGAGAIVLPGISTDNALVRWDGATGDALQNSTLVLNDLGDLTGLRNLSQTGYTDFAETGVPGAPAVNIARLFAYDVAGRTKLAYKDSFNKTSILLNFVSLKDYGAVGDGVTNDNAAWAAAIADINAGTVKALLIPAGAYVVNPGHVITRGGWTIYGEGSKASSLVLSSAGDFLKLEGVSTFRDVEIRNLLININSVINPTTGRALHLSGVDSANLFDLDIYGFYQGIDLEGCISIVTDNLQMFASSSWSGVQTGSFGIRIRKGGPTNRNSSSLWLSNFAISGSTPPNNYLQTSLWVQGCDTIWAVNGHFGFSNLFDLLVEPVNDVDAFILNLEFHNVYFDGGFGGDVNGAGIGMFGSATPIVDCIGFIGCQVNIHDGYGANIGLTQLRDLRFTGCTFRENGKSAINVSLADNVTVSDSYFRGNNAIGGGGHDCLSFDDITGLNISGNHVMAGTNAHPNGINIQAGTTLAVVEANVVTGHTNQIGDNGTGTVIRSNPGISDNSMGFVAPASGVGGSVTQITNKSTSVALNKKCGQIIMEATTAIAGGASAFFNMNNSLITSKSVVNVVHSADGGTIGSYEAKVRGVFAGGVALTVTNITGGSLSQAVALNFVVIEAQNN